MGNFEKPREDVSEKARAKEALSGLMPKASEMGKADMETKQEVTAEDLKKANPGYSEANPRQHKEVVAKCRDAIREANGGKAPQSGDVTKYEDKVYNPDTQEMEVTAYVYGVDKNGGDILLKKSTETRAATSAEKAENAPAADEYAEANIRNPKALPKAEGDKIIAAISKASGEKLAKNGDSFLYKKAELSGVGIKISGNVFYAVRVDGRNYAYTGTAFA